MTIPFVDMKQTGQNIYILREQCGISVKELQHIRNRELLLITNITSTDHVCRVHGKLAK